MKEKYKKLRELILSVKIESESFVAGRCVERELVRQTNTQVCFGGG